MKCWSRSTLGVVVGIINILCLIAATIIAAYFIIQLDKIEPGNYLERNEIARSKTVFSILITFYLVMVIICVLFVMGIVKRRHKLMLPWLILSCIGFVLNCGRILFEFFGAIFSGAGISTLLVILVVGALGIGISGLILWLICRLYGDIRKNNIEGVGKINAGPEVGYKSPENY